MKKIFKLAALSLLTLTLSGCNHNNPSDSQSNSSNSSGDKTTSTPISSVGQHSVESVTITNENKTLQLDLHKKITGNVSVSVLPIDANQTVSYKSNDETVATVDASGVVTAHAVGETTIVVSSTEDETKKDTLNVVVKDSTPIDINKWLSLMQGNVKLDGKYYSIATDVTTGQIQQKDEYREFVIISDVRYYNEDENYNTIDEYYPDSDGNTVTKYLNENNEIVEEYDLDDDNQPYSYADNWYNPMEELQLKDYKICDDDPKAFTLADETAYDDFGYDITLYNETFTSIKFREENDKLYLRLDLQNDASSDGTIKHEYYFEYEISAPTENDLKCPIAPFEQTEDSQRLQTAFEQMATKKNYTIARTSQKIATFDIGSNTRVELNNEPIESWNVKYSEQLTYNEKTKDGIKLYEIDGNDAWYKYSLDENNMFVKGNPALIEGADSFDDCSYNYIPDYSLVSAAVFDCNYDSVKETYTYTIKDDLGEPYIGWIYGDLLEDYSCKYSATLARPTYGGYEMEIVLDNSNNMTMSFELHDVDNKTADYKNIITKETYEYKDFDATTITLPEEVMNDLLDGDWESDKDDLEDDDPYKTSGIILEVSKENKTIKFNSEAATNVVVKDGKVTFTADGKNFTYEYKDSYPTLYFDDASNTRHTYQLMEKGHALAVCKSKAKSSIEEYETTNKNAIEALSDEIETGQTKSKKTQATEIKETALQSIDNATTKEDVTTALNTYTTSMNTLLGL